MADCPALSSEDGKLIFSTDARSAGTVVVIGCSGFGRHKTDPTSVLCTGGIWSPAPTPDCESGFDNREVLLLGVGVGCAFLALVVLICLCCCCCCFFNGQPKDMHRWRWMRNYGWDGGYALDRGNSKFSSYGPRRDVRVTHWESSRPEYDERSFRSFGKMRRYSNEFDNRRSRGKTEVFTREAFIPDYDFFEDKFKPRVSEHGYSRREMGRSGSNNDFVRKPALEYTFSRRHSAGSREEMMRGSAGNAHAYDSQVMEVSGGGGYSTGNDAGMLRETGYSINRAADLGIEEYSNGNDAGMLRGTGYSINRATDLAIEEPAVVRYVQTEQVVQPIAQPIVQYVENVQYVEKPAVQYVENSAVQYVENSAAQYVENSAAQYGENSAVQYVEKPAVQYVEKIVQKQPIQYIEKVIEKQPIQYVQNYVKKQPIIEQYVENQQMGMIERHGSYTASFIVGGSSHPVGVEDQTMYKYDQNGFSSLRSLRRANITEVTNGMGAKVVPYRTSGSLRSTQNLDPTMYFLGRQDYTHNT